jgi:hypothetical protein
MARKQISCFHEELSKWSLFLAFSNAIHLSKLGYDSFQMFIGGTANLHSYSIGKYLRILPRCFSDVLWIFIVNFHYTCSLDVHCMFCSQTPAGFERCELSFVIPIPLLRLGSEIAFLRSLSNYRSKCIGVTIIGPCFFLGLQICRGSTDNLKLDAQHIWFGH